RLLTADGRTTWVLQSSSLLRDESGMPLYYVEQFVDVTENRASREQLDFQTRHDPLTRLANRHGFDEAVSHLFDGDQGDDRGHAVLFCDLDNFKAINDQFGHAVGDQVLAAAAARVQSGIRTEDTAARIGGDEFVILLRDVSEPAVASAVGDQLRAAVSLPIRNLDNPALRVTMSVGVAISDPGSDPRAVLREADDALYRAKSTGRNRVVVSAAASTRPG
ncbi:MAG: diguanylate cyclase, partial [Candidatus Nanopelagicales bacterium]|nr:diguanylate cyclase [Candidatus Nanopelagicales bacterium]